jgi:thiol-disulfide isomerase/thioredoxin
MVRLTLGSSLLALASLMACTGSAGPNGPHDRATPRAASKHQTPASPAPTQGSRPEFVSAGEGDADAVVRDALHDAQDQQRQLVVYVGATWCEPCQAFHDAVERGELDEALAGVRFIEFDSDHDSPRLRTAGYAGRYIPRFVVPQPDGQASDQRIEGGIKGEGAVAHIMERLGPLLADRG